MSELRTKAIVFEDVGKVVLKEIDLPEPTADDIVVETVASGVSVGSERWAYVGKRTEMTFPFVPGYMGIGEVVEMGDKADNLGYARGQLVNFFHSQIAPPYDGSWMGAHLARAVINVTREFAPGSSDCHTCLRLPEGLSPLGASLCGLCAVALRGIELATVPVGAKVLVNGLGVIGQYAAQVVQLKGAQACAVDIDERRVEIARRLGADWTVNPNKQDLAEAAAEIAPGGFDIIIDTSSIPEIVNSVFPLLRWGGQFIFQGWYPPPSPLDIWKMQRLSTCYFPSGHNNAGVAAAMRWVAAGKLDTESLITHVASPDEAPEIFKMIEENEEEFLGIVFDWQAQ